MTNSNTLHSVCSSRRVTIRELSSLVGSSPSDIIFAAQGGAGSAPLRQRIAESLGATCWEDLLYGSNRTVRAKTDAQLNMKCLVVLEDEPPEVLYSGGSAKMYRFDDLFYVESRVFGKLFKQQFFDKETAFGEYLCAIARG